MKKSLSFLCLVALVGIVGCGPAATPEPAAAEPDATLESASDEAPEADDTTRRDARPPQGRLVQAKAKTATLRVKFVYDGKPPAPQKIDASKDPFCAQTDVLTENMLVNKDGGLRNVALILDARRSKAEIPAAQLKAPEAVIELDNNKCIFVPHVIFARPGQTIEVLNSDPVGHNANFNFFNNQAVNFLIPTGGKKQVKLQAEEPAPIPVECNIHPWMRAYTIVTEHPFVGISDENGVLEIADLPVGEVSFKIWHENQEGAIDEGTVDGKTQKYRRGRMELELKAGINDLGTIKLAADKFRD
ncbi:MAG: hypothetical protein KDA45_00060 [Planctomycetales bacterium]|nr:hypothetical protein [Planctomycetales bacterium]